MENRDSFEEEEATITAISLKYKKYEVLFLKVALQKVSEETSVYVAPKKYDIPEQKRSNKTEVLKKLFLKMC